MKPTSVPTYSTVIGTSRSITGSTLTTAAGGGAEARDWPQPAAAATIRPISKPVSRVRRLWVMNTSRRGPAMRVLCVKSVGRLRWLRDRLLPGLEQLVKLSGGFGVLGARCWIITPGIGPLQCGDHGAGDRDRPAAVVALAHEVPLGAGRDVTGEAIAAESIDDVGEASLTDLRTISPSLASPWP